MRHAWLAVLVLASCDKLPARPAEKEFEALGPGGKCKATAPRAMRCSDELMVAQIRALAMEGGGEMADVIEKDLKDSAPLLEKNPQKDREAMHKLNCVGGPSYAEAVYKCWSIEDCKTFADCVMKP